MRFSTRPRSWPTFYVAFLPFGYHARDDFLASYCEIMDYLSGLFLSFLAHAENIRVGIDLLSRKRMIESLFRSDRECASTGFSDHPYLQGSLWS